MFAEKLRSTESSHVALNPINFLHSCGTFVKTDETILIHYY